MELNKLNANFKPQSVMTDFEQAALLAFKTVYPDIQQRGCLFHMGQCLWRKIKSMEDLRLRYISDPDVALCIRQLLSLAFVPSSDVVAAFDELVESSFFRENEEMVLHLVNYFEDNWIGRGEADEVLRCSSMLCGTVSTPFIMIYREQITQ